MARVCCAASLSGTLSFPHLGYGKKLAIQAMRSRLWIEPTHDLAVGECPRRSLKPFLSLV